MKKRFTEAQIVGFLREADAGIPVKDLCGKHGCSDASYSLWRSKFGGMSVSDAQRLKELEIENGRLKNLLEDSGPSVADDVVVALHRADVAYTVVQRILRSR
jgi:putative transposase